MVNKVVAGRLAMRQEGEWWNAYYVMNDTMSGALHLGSINMRLVIDNEERKEMFLEFMRNIGASIINEVTGQIPEWTEATLAPDHERGGNA
jgi:hypothetical protein